MRCHRRGLTGTKSFGILQKHRIAPAVIPARGLFAFCAPRIANAHGLTTGLNGERGTTSKASQVRTRFRKARRDAQSGGLFSGGKNDLLLSNAPHIPGGRCA